LPEVEQRLRAVAMRRLGPEVAEALEAPAEGERAELEPTLDDTGFVEVGPGLASPGGEDPDAEPATGFRVVGLASEGLGSWVAVFRKLPPMPPGEAGERTWRANEHGPE